MFQRPRARYIDEFLSHLTAFVNPKELSASPAFFDQLLSATPKAVLVRLAISIDHYEPSAAIPRLRPTPDTCGMYSRADWEKAKRAPQELTDLNTLFDTTRKKVLPLMREAGVEDHKARWLCQAFERAAMRYFFGKKSMDLFPTEKGKYSGERWVGCRSQGSGRADPGPT